MWAEEQDWFGLEDVVTDSNFYYCQLLDNKAWECKDGTVIFISDMDTKHILACMRLIAHSNFTWREEFIPLFKEELAKRNYRK
jgi:hypothetical protein